jgi:hypothetical protein
MLRLIPAEGSGPVGWPGGLRMGPEIRNIDGSLSGPTAVHRSSGVGLWARHPRAAFAVPPVTGRFPCSQM